MILLMPLYAYMVMRQKLQDDEEESDNELENHRLFLEQSMEQTSYIVSEQLAPLMTNLSLENEPKLWKKVDFSKFIMKNEYTLVRQFENTIELLIWQKEESYHLKVSHSNYVNFSLMDCGEDLHRCRIQCMHSECCKKCELKFRVKACLTSNYIEVSRSYEP